MSPAEFDPPSLSPRQRAAEILLIILVFFLYAGWPPPAVNEAHYLAKSRHYWSPEWCAGDLFLESANIHLAFYWTVGWLTRFLSLPGTAWMGRWMSWLLLAIGWQRLSQTLVPRRFLSVLTAALFLVLTHYGQMSGEWVVGGVEAKSFSYPLVLFAITALIQDRWRAACVWLGLATSFHVLVGGWSCVAAGVAWALSRESRPRLVELLPWLAVTLILALPGLLPPLWANRGVSSEVLREANRIYVYERLSHHLIFHRFPHAFMVRHALLIGVWLVISPGGFVTPCQRRLPRFVSGAILIAVAGVVVDQATLYFPRVAAGLLKYYWFRLSDVITPLGVALGWAVWYQRWCDEYPPRAAWSLTWCLLGVSVGLGVDFLPKYRDPRPAAVTMTEPGDLENAQVGQASYRDWLLVCHWIETHTPPDQTVLTPRQQQTFKWYASRPEFFSWKDVPQDAPSLIRWWERREMVWAARVAVALPPDETTRLPLDELYREGVRYWVVRQPEIPRHPSLLRVYPTRFEPNSTYAVYVLRPPGATREPGGKPRRAS